MENHNKIQPFDLIGRKISVGDRIIVYVQNSLSYAYVTKILDNGLIKTDKQHYCFFPNKVILMDGK